LICATQASDALVKKGDDLYDLNKYDESITAYDKAIKINPQDSHAWYNKSILSKHNKSNL
jgi:superkiller protein 3